MVLKKPFQLFESKNSSKEVPAPVRTTTPLMNNFNETFDRFKNNLDKVEELNEKINILTENLSTKLSKEDLEGAIFSHLLVVEENFKELEEQFKTISKRSLREFKANVEQLTEVVEELVEEELPDYKKKVTETEIKISQQFNSLQENVENNLVAIEENLQEKLEGFSDSIENVLSGFDTTLQETKSDVLETIETYNKLRKILENKVLNDEDKIGEYSQVLEDFNQRFVEFERSVSSQVEDYEKTFSSIVEQLNESIENKFDTYDNVIEVFKGEVNKNVLDIKADVVINEQHLKKVEKYLQKNHQELIDLKEEVFGELEKITYGDIQENVERLNKKIQYIEEVYKNIEPEVIVKEVIQEGLLNGPSSTKNSDPLTPLDQNFVTLDQLQQHYRLFLNRIQQQLATLGGGGETRLKYLDDIVGIATNASAYDGKFLKYDHSQGKFEFVTVSAGGGGDYASVAGISTVSEGLTGTPNIEVGIVTATSYFGDGSNLSGVVTSLVGYATEGYVNNSIVGFITSGGSVNYSNTSGVSTVSQGLTGTPNIVVGIITSDISIPTQLKTKSVAEKTTLVSGNSVSLVFNTGGGNVAICTNPTGNITLNVTGIPTDSSFDNHSISFSVIVQQTGTARTCTAVTLNGVTETIRWAGGSLANAISGVTTSNGYDIFTFTGINTVGSASTTANYVVLGSVNGGFN